jgi:adenylyltransferase/sulfurtransferase
MKEITARELRQMREQGVAFELIDVREPYETEVCSIGGKPLPMSQLMDHLAEIPRDKPVVLHCRSGSRSCAVVDTLSTRYGFTNLMHLKGGIMAWQSEVDHSLHCD